MWVPFNLNDVIDLVSREIIFSYFVDRKKTQKEIVEQLHEWDYAIFCVVFSAL